MFSISEYRNRNREPIELPSGMKGWIRKPTLADLSKYPALLSVNFLKGKMSVEAAKEAIMMALRRCFTPEGGVMTDKEPGACLPNELSVEDFDPDDALFIWEAVNALVDPPDGEGEAAEAKKKFPAGNETIPDQPGPGGEEVRDPAPSPDGSDDGK